MRKNLGPDVTKLRLKQGFLNYHKIIIFLLVKHHKEILYVAVSQGGWQWEFSTFKFYKNICKELLLVALWQRHLYLGAFSAAAQRKTIEVLSNSCGGCSEKQLRCRKKGTNKTHELHNSSFKYYYLTASLVWSPTIAAFLLAVLLTPPKSRWNMGNSNGKALQHSLTEIPRKFKYCTLMHTSILILFSSPPESSFQSVPWHQFTDHMHAQKATVLLFSCLLILTPRKNYCSYETAKVTKTIEQLHSCAVLSFLLFRSVTHRFTKFSSW